MGINSKGTLQYSHALSSPFGFQLELNILEKWPILIILVYWKIMKLELPHVLKKSHEGGSQLVSVKQPNGLVAVLFKFNMALQSSLAQKGLLQILQVAEFVKYTIYSIRCMWLWLL